MAWGVVLFFGEGEFGAGEFGAVEIGEEEGDGGGGDVDGEDAGGLGFEADDAGWGGHRWSLRCRGVR